MICNVCHFIMKSNTARKLLNISHLSIDLFRTPSNPFSLVLEHKPILVSVFFVTSGRESIPIQVG